MIRQTKTEGRQIESQEVAGRARREISAQRHHYLLSSVRDVVTVWRYRTIETEF